MKRSPRKLLLHGARLATMAAVLLCGGIASAETLSVCIDTSNPMAAVDRQLAQAVAANEGAALRVQEYDSSQNDTVNGMAGFSTLTDKCALVLGFPFDTDASQEELGGLHATKPYAHTAFVLVTRAADDAKSLDQLPRGSRVALVYMTPPTLYLMDQPDLKALVETRNDAAFESLLAGKASAALLWHPAVVAYEVAHADAALAAHAVHQPHTRFNLVALYDGRNASAAQEFEHAIATMQASGALQKVLGKYADAGPAGSADVGSPPAPDAAAGSARPALYTAAQARAGKQKFADNCAMCHGANLEGGVGPALTGPHFAPAKSDYHVGDIFTIVAHNMPATEPGSLTHDDYAVIMAYLLQQNGYPAGSKTLGYGKAMTSKVPFVSK